MAITSGRAIVRHAWSLGRLAKGAAMTIIEKIKELVAEGLSRDEIANRLGLTVGSLQITCSRLSLRRAGGQARDNDATPRQSANG
jgi:hypothetical protein